MELVTNWAELLYQLSAKEGTVVLNSLEDDKKTIGLPASISLGISDRP